jgi:haloacetate dehalogenase
VTADQGRGPECPGYDPASIWRQYAPDVRGKALPAGHFVPEEAPDLVIDALRDFLG